MAASQRWYSPDDVWPVHPRSYFREVLKKARDAGWMLEKHTAHSFGTIYCKSDGQDRCELLIYTTGSGGENVAKDHAKRIDRCPHLRDDQRLRLQRCARLIEQANKLVTAADTILAARDARDDEAAGLARAADLYEMAREATDQAASLYQQEADELFDVAREYEREAIDQEASAAAQLEDLHFPPGSQAEDVVAGAAQTADDASADLAVLPRRNVEVAQAAAELVALRAQLDRLKSRLSDA